MTAKPRLREILNAHVKSLELVATTSDDGWRVRHYNAWIAPRPIERGIRDAIVAYVTLADGYSQANLWEMALGEDGYFAEHAKAMIEALIAYLNLDCGRFDCGTLDRLIRELAAASGVDPE